MQHDPNDYAEVREALDKNEYVRRIYITFTNKALDRFYERNVALAKEMINPDLVLYPNVNPIVCKSCPYSYPCNIKLDISHKLAEQYVLTNFTTSNYTQRALDEVGAQ